MLRVDRSFAPTLHVCGSCRLLSKFPSQSKRCSRQNTLVCTAVPGPPPRLDTQLTSATNPYVKHCVKLRTSRSYRLQTQRLLLSGVAPLAELTAGCGNVTAHTLLVCGGDVPPGLPPADRVVSVSPAVMRKLAGLDSLPSGQLTAGRHAMQGII